MKPWLKVAIGCIAVAVIACFLLVAGLVGLGFWAKNKVQEVTSGGASVEEARKVTHENASALFGHPLPADVRP